MTQINPAHLNSVQSAASASKSNASQSEKKVSKPKDDVSISSESQKLADLESEKTMVMERAKILPDVRNSLLSQAKEKMFSGYYDSKEFSSMLADKLIKGDE